MLKASLAPAEVPRSLPTSWNHYDNLSALTQAIHSLGSFGKTQLAVEYA